MSEETTTSDGAQHRQVWLKRLADEFVKLEPQMPLKNFLPEADGPAWLKTWNGKSPASCIPSPSSRNRWH